MPEININACDYHYEIFGSGSETIVLSHGLLFNLQMFHYQIKDLSKNYRIIAYDHRGQGRSEVTEEGYDMDQLYADMVQMIEKLSLGAVHFAGLSMGGFVGLRLAARRPDLVKSLILMETSARAEPNKLKYSALSAIVKLFGTGPVSNRVLKIIFGRKFLTDPARKDEREKWKKHLLELPKNITLAVSGVIRRKDVIPELEHIQCPTLILVGDQDVATTPEEAAYLHEHIAGSTLVTIKDAGHSSCLEEPEQCNKAIRRFLEGL